MGMETFKSTKKDKQKTEVTNRSNNGMNNREMILFRKKCGFKEPWIGVDLDGVLAIHPPYQWQGYDWIGEPVPQMIQRVKRWLRAGRKVKIFTARVEGGKWACEVIHRWLVKQGLPKLEITNVKDSGLSEIWDDLAVRVEINTGRTCCPYRKNWKVKKVF